jgi:ferredoxin-thioredoxin reductase catalytic subunit
MEDEAPGREEKIRADSEEHAAQNGIFLNPDPKFVDAVVAGLAKNEDRHGKRFCPCRPITGDPEADGKIVCPCAYHKEELERDGRCHCRLFVKK